MAATDKIDHLETMREAVSILRGENSAWKGDRINNVEFFLSQIARAVDLLDARVGQVLRLEGELQALPEAVGQAQVERVELLRVHARSLMTGRRRIWVPSPPSLYFQPRLLKGKPSGFRRPYRTDRTPPVADPGEEVFASRRVF